MGQHEGNDDRRSFGRYVVARTRHESETSSRQTGGELPLFADRQQGVAFTREDERIGMDVASTSGKVVQGCRSQQCEQPTVRGGSLPRPRAVAVRFAPSNPLIAYAGTGDDDASDWGMGIMKSTDGGLTWARIDNGSATTGVIDGTVLSKLEVAPDKALYSPVHYDIVTKLKPTLGPHILTGPIAIRGAVRNARTFVMRSGPAARASWAVDVPPTSPASAAPADRDARNWRRSMRRPPQ